jgi:hypothetical protein
MIFEILTLLFTTLFFGASLYVTIVEQPARLACQTAAALAQWRPSFKRAAAMQIFLTIAGVICAVVAYFIHGNLIVLAGGLVLATVAPYTLIILMPVNRQLLNPSRTAETPDTDALIEKWGKLHFVRTVVSFIALLLQIANISMLLQ